MTKKRRNVNSDFEVEVAKFKGTEKRHHEAFLLGTILSQSHLPQN